MVWQLSHSVNSIEKVSVCWAGGRWFKSWPDHHSGSLNNRGEKAAFDENKWRVADERTADVPSYNIIYFNMWTVSSDVSPQRRHWQLLSVHLWAYGTHPSHDVNDVMRVGWPQHRGLCALLFSNSGVGSFMSHKNQISVKAVRQDLQFKFIML